MATNSKVCACGTCPGVGCNCGCQAVKAAPQAGCQCRPTTTPAARPAVASGRNHEAALLAYNTLRSRARKWLAYPLLATCALTALGARYQTSLDRRIFRRQGGSSMSVDGDYT